MLFSFASAMMGFDRSSDSWMVQFVFVLEKVSVAAANREISLVLDEESGAVEGEEASGEGVEGGEGYAEEPFVFWRMLTMFLRPRMFGVR